MIMNRLLIPSILAATVLVAAIFVFVPVQKASTVHNTITSNICTALYGAAACPAVLTAVTATVAGGAGSADLTAQDRAFTWDIETDAAETVILIPAVAGKDMSGRTVLNSSTAAETCTIEDDDGTDISVATGAGVDDSDAFDTAGGGTPVGFVSGDGINLTTSAATRCFFTIYFQTLEP
jgi:hypothetical protein